MLRLEGFMEIQKLHHDGVSVSEIARQLDMDRKTVRKYLRQAPREYERKPRIWKVDPFRAYLRERWEVGVRNAAKLFVELRKRGYTGGTTQGGAADAAWRSEGQGRAVRRVGRRWGPETKGKMESTIGFLKGNFWRGIQFDSLSELNRQALVWCGEVNRRVHATTREIPQVRFAHEGLTALNGQPKYDTSY